MFNWLQSAFNWIKSFSLLQSLSNWIKSFSLFQSIINYIKADLMQMGLGFVVGLVSTIVIYFLTASILSAITIPILIFILIDKFAMSNFFISYVCSLIGYAFAVFGVLFFTKIL